MSVDFKTFLEISGLCLDSKLPVLIRGRHGVGKSEVVYMMAEQRVLPVVERRASQMTEGDLLGLPAQADIKIPDYILESDEDGEVSDVREQILSMVENRQATAWDAPDWLVQACISPVLLFLDEVDRATLEVRQGLFELTDSRKINGWKLHPDTLIMAAVNGGEHGSQYQVGEMDPAEIDRWTVFDVEPSVEDWLVWAKDNVHPLLWDFINHNHAHLEHVDDFEPNKVYPSRRSWKRFNDTAVRTSVLEEGGNLSTLFHLGSAFCGLEAAMKLRDFVKTYSFQVTVQDIIDDGKFEKLEKWEINDHLAMVNKMVADSRLTETMTDENLENLSKYWHMLPGEIAVMMSTSICNVNKDLYIRWHHMIQERFVALVGEATAEK
jgi:hypothetical protein